jgi:hypothetical protein
VRFLGVAAEICGAWHCDVSDWRSEKAEHSRLAEGGAPAELADKFAELCKAKGFFRSLGPSIVPSEAQLEQLSAVEDVLMIGYPNGLWDAVNNYPLIRRGITASHPAVDFDVNGVATTVVDVACFPGSSGSPVILHNHGIYGDKRGNTVTGSRTIFLGVLFSGPVIQADGKIVIRNIPTTLETIAQVNLMMNLGYIVKSKELAALGAAVLAKIGPIPPPT